MLTNPNTAGLFESQIGAIAETVHGVGGMLYYDGANLNAILGVTNPGRMGFDVAHLNLHKTFATPHGGGGPGAGVLAPRTTLGPYLPVPRIVKRGRSFRLDYDRPKSIGKIKTGYGNFGLDLRAYTFLLTHGEEGLRHISRRAVLNANYLGRSSGSCCPVRSGPLVKHEFLLSGTPLKANGVRTLDLAKRLLDEGYHAPTIYFPSLVDEALMIEFPGDREPPGARRVRRRVRARGPRHAGAPPRGAPTATSVRRVDEVLAARQLHLSRKDFRDPRHNRLEPRRPSEGPMKDRVRKRVLAARPPARCRRARRTRSTRISIRASSTCSTSRADSSRGRSPSPTGTDVSTSSPRCSRPRAPTRRRSRTAPSRST